MKTFTWIIAVLFTFPAIGLAKVQIKQNKPKEITIKTPANKTTIKTLEEKTSTERKTDVSIEKVTPPQILTSSQRIVHISSVQRPLLLPLGSINIDGTLQYHYLTSGHMGANIYAKTRYSHFEDWEFTGEISAFPQTREAFEFGGIRIGFLYRALPENNENPEVALGVKGGFLGTGIYSLTKDNDLSIFPNISAKKQLTNNLSLEGELMVGIGNKDAGIASLNTTGYLKTTPEIDIRIKLDLQNLGYSLDEIISLAPAIEYHFKQNLDIIGGMQLGLLGTEYLGNNLFVGMASRF